MASMSQAGVEAVDDRVDDKRPMSDTTPPQTRLPEPRFPQTEIGAPSPRADRDAEGRSSGRGWWFLSITATNFWLDVILLVLFLSLFWVSLVLRFAFPPGPAADGWRLWGYTYVGWSNVRFYLVCGLGAAVILHLMLHWNWVCSVVLKWLRHGKPKKPMAKDDPMRTIWGVILLIVVLGAMGVLLGLAKLTIVSPFE